MSADIDALYKRAKAILWVEDSETRAWLDAVWQGRAPTILVQVAGGQANVLAVCEQAKDAGWKHIFGLVDQDFGTSNRHRWASLDPAERVYRLDVHELENLLLNSLALQGCNLNTGERDISDIEDRLFAAARERVWWVACTRFLADTRQKAIDGYPSDPTGPKKISSLADAEAYVKTTTWFQRTAAQCPALAEPAAISAALEAAHADADEALADMSWKQRFPGKQIFRDISGYVYQNGKGRSARLDLIKAVGSWQRENKALPPQATELHHAIVARI